MKIRAGLMISVAFLASATGLTPVSANGAVSPESILANYANIAFAKYEDSLMTAKKLDAAVNEFLQTPTKNNLNQARVAWLAARVPYQQSEVYRFGNAIVDDWEGRVNAWPLDEGLIDYVDASYGLENDENTLYTANIIANKKLNVNGKPINASKITPAFLQSMHEAGEVEANVTTGYHAIEFMLWGQDLNGTGKGAGSRPASDFDTKNCTNGNCDRRGDYLKSVSALLISDLEEMLANWTVDGKARAKLLEAPKAGLTSILIGMGSLSYGELAGERMKLGLLLHDPEEEHDCFSDNSHNSHLFDAKGVQNVYLGSYTRVDGSVVSGASLASLVATKNADLDKELTSKLEVTMAAMNAMAERAVGGESYDQMIGEGNKSGNAAVQAAIDGLIDQTQSIERVFATLDLGKAELEGSDSLDNPNAIFN